MLKIYIKLEIDMYSKLDAKYMARTMLMPYHPPVWGQGIRFMCFLW